MNPFKPTAFFPDPKSRDSIRFHFGKNLTYRQRMTLAFSCLLFGLALQILMLNVLWGVPFLICTTAVLLTKGYDSRIRKKSFRPDALWTKVNMPKINEIKMLEQRNIDWDQDFLDITNVRGCFGFMVLGAVIGGMAFGVNFISQDLRLSIIILVDSAILILPFWVTGVKFITTNSNLQVKIKVILEMARFFNGVQQGDETFQPEVLLYRKKKNETIPDDARFSVSTGKKADGFYGLQGNIHINLVQGSSYPYMYCVLAAQPGFGLKRFIPKIRQTEKIIVEYQEDEKAEVIVIRQFTSKTSGYNTPMPVCEEILKRALDAARLIWAES